jgi:adenylosuccinate lyase
MPHKDVHNGNPVAEEQMMSDANYLRGTMMTALCNCDFPYARNLSASANSRINSEDAFKFTDHAARRLARVAYYIALRPERCKERITRSLGMVTSPQILAYLTDSRMTAEPMPRSVAHDLLGTLASQSWDFHRPFADTLCNSEDITRRIPVDKIRELADPMNYIGESQKQIRAVFDKYHGIKTF